MRALVLVDHGSRSPDAARATETVAGAVRERLGPSWQVRVAHLELEPPHPPEVIDACVAQGASDIVIHPYFLAPGRHASEDMARVVEQARARHSSVRFVLTDPLGPDPVLADLVLARAGLRARFVVVRQHPGARAAEVVGEQLLRVQPRHAGSARALKPLADAHAVDACQNAENAGRRFSARRPRAARAARRRAPRRVRW